jgi:hypothetical protein
LNYQTIAAPLLLAIKAVLDGTPDALQQIEPELRRAATWLYQQLRCGLRAKN